MTSASIPSGWFTITRSWAARDMLALLKEVDERGIDHNDLVAVQAVWDEMKGVK